MTELEQQIIDIALGDPDAFDADRVNAEGAAYVCDPLGYSEELDGLCKKWSEYKYIEATRKAMEEGYGLMIRRSKADLAKDYPEDK